MVGGAAEVNPKVLVNGGGDVVDPGLTADVDDDDEPVGNGSEFDIVELGDGGGWRAK